jgi:hypothetical protein
LGIKFPVLELWGAYLSLSFGKAVNLGCRPCPLAYRMFPYRSKLEMTPVMTFVFCSCVFQAIRVNAWWFVLGENN